MRRQQQQQQIVVCVFFPWLECLGPLGVWTNYLGLKQLCNWDSLPPISADREVSDPTWHFSKTQRMQENYWKLSDSLVGRNTLKKKITYENSRYFEAFWVNICVFYKIKVLRVWIFCVFTFYQICKMVELSWMVIFFISAGQFLDDCLVKFTNKFDRIF